MNQELNQGLETVGIDLDSGTLRAVRIDSEGKVLFRSEAPFDAESESVPQIAGFLNEIESKSGSFESCGLAIPGLVDISKNKVVYSSKLTDHNNADLAGQIAAATGRRIVLENDANAAAYGELTIGAGTSVKDFFYVTTGQGVGGALILDRKVWHGVTGFAGEFGYIAINEEGTHLEDLVAADGVVRRAKTRLHQDPASSLFEIGEEKITFEDVIEACVNEDGLAELIMERTGMFLGIAVAGVINLLNIEKVIIGGGLMKAGEIVLDAVIKRASELTFEPAFEAVSIETGALGDDAVAIGAALLARNRQA